MIICKYLTWIKLFLKLFLVATTTFCLYCIITQPVKDDLVLWACFPIPFICVWGWFYTDCFKLEIGENEITQYGVKNHKVIKYVDVVAVLYHNNALTLKSNHTTIMISTDLTNKKEAISYVTKRLKPIIGEIEEVETKWWESIFYGALTIL
ncbi:hypothetical protein BH09BAC1_BH09BAC1_24800 [soil metagenome]